MVQFGKTIVYRDVPFEDFEYKLPVPGKIFIREKNLDITAEICKNHSKADPRGDIHYFCLGMFKDGIDIRNRRNGDIIKPWKGRGTVKLKKYFIDKKIERPMRDNLIVLACGGSVAYIEGLDYGKDFMPSEGSKVVKISFERR